MPNTGFLCGCGVVVVCAVSYLKNNLSEDIVHQHLQDTQAAYLECLHVKRKLEYKIRRGANCGKVVGKCVALYGSTCQLKQTIITMRPMFASRACMCAIL